MANDQQKTQKGQGLPDYTEDQARQYFENIRWPDGPCCIHCGSVKVVRLAGTAARDGVLQCNDCRKQFTVTVGTVMEDSHLPLAKWAKAFHLMASSKKGISALQMQRNLGLGSYRTAWHLCHRIRYAMRTGTEGAVLKGEVQVDESYIGPSRDGRRKGSDSPPRKRGRGTTTKTPVMVLVETNGNAHAHPIESVNTHTLKTAMEAVIHPSARIVTDELRSYRRAAAGFAGGHTKVTHCVGEYVAPDGSHTNTAESFFALLKRGVHGTFHHVSKKHLGRYCHEFSFRWDGRGINDVARRDMAVRGAEGKRLFLYQPAGEA